MNRTVRGGDMQDGKVKFKFSWGFGILFFGMIGLLIASGILLISNARVILDQAEAQRVLMNEQEQVIDELLFTATQIQELLTSGLLSRDVQYKLEQKEIYDIAMEQNTQRLQRLSELQFSTHQTAYYDRMIAARNVNTQFRDRIIEECMAGSGKAVNMFNGMQRDFNKMWLNSILEYAKVTRADNNTVLADIRARANKMIAWIVLSYAMAGILLLLLAIQVFLSGRQSAKLLYADLAINEALDRAMLVNKVSPDGIITSVNENMCQLTGYTPEELIGSNARIFNSGYHSKEFFKDLWDTVSSGSIWQGVIRNKGKHGDFLWMNTVIVPLQDPTGAILDHLVFRTDVTEALQLRDKLEKSDAFNRAILNSIEEQMAVIDPEGKLMSTNHAWRSAPEASRTCLHETEIGINYLRNRKASADKGTVPCQLLLQASEKFNGNDAIAQYFEFEAPFPSGSQWFAVLLKQVEGMSGHLLLSISDITVRQEARLAISNAKETLELEVVVRTKELQLAKASLEQRNFDITSGIHYASRITNAVLPSLTTFKAHFPDHFLLSRPLDIVGGDFLWWGVKDGMTMVAAVDCTGHGVPGSLMSIIATRLLNDSVEWMDWTNPGSVLAWLDRQLIRQLAISPEKQQVADGMDIALCVFDHGLKKVYTAGAYRPIFHTDINGTLVETRGDVYSIGGGSSGYDKSFRTNELDLFEGMMVYLTSDGYQSQFGGPSDSKFGKRQLRELLKQISVLPLEEQNKMLAAAFEKWKGKEDQTDDVLVVGLRF